MLPRFLSMALPGSGEHTQTGKCHRPDGPRHVADTRLIAGRSLYMRHRADDRLGGYRQVFSTNFALADARSVPAYETYPPQPYTQALSRIWPIRRSRLQWPPSAYVSPDVLDKVTNWG